MENDSPNPPGIQFRATLPEIQSAISVGGDGARLKLDIPESDIGAIMNLAYYGRGKVLNIWLNMDDTP